jgi:uncharacterized protein (TIGR03067 family)
LNGVFRVVPKIDLTGFKHEIVEPRIRLRDGLLAEGAVPPADERSADQRPAPSPAMIQEAIRTDQRLLQGTWMLTSATLRGRSGGVQGDIRWSITGDRMVIELNGRWEGKFTLDPARSPKRITLVATSPDGKKTEEIRGVYELRGDELHVCMDTGDEPRPASVSYSPNTNQVSLVLKREQP